MSWIVWDNFKENDMSKRQYIQNATEYLDTNEPDLTITDWQGGKLKGTYFKRKNAEKYTVNVENKSKNITKKIFMNKSK